MNKGKILIIVGPTASGKSALAVHLARKFSARGRSALGGNGAEIISADSRQVYRGLNIGTGKITKKEMRGVPHHLLDVANPKKPFSAADFVIHAQQIYSSILQKTAIPILVGGTGYYIDAFVGGVILPDVPPNMNLRAKMEGKSARQLYELLQKRDPARAKAMASDSERNNARRLIRAIEIATAIGKVPLSEPSSEYDTLWIGINPPLKELEQKIQKRLIERLRSGMITEAVRLHKNGLTFKRMEELGLEYRSLARFLRGDISKSEMVAELERDIRRYAKKQMAYWRRNPDIKWLKPSQIKQAEGLIRTWLNK